MNCRRSGDTGADEPPWCCRTVHAIRMPSLVTNRGSGRLQSDADSSCQAFPDGTLVSPRVVPQVEDRDKNQILGIGSGCLHQNQDVDKRGRVNGGGCPLFGPCLGEAMMCARASWVFGSS